MAHRLVQAGTRAESWDMKSDAVFDKAKHVRFWSIVLKKSVLGAGLVWLAR